MSAHPDEPFDPATLAQDAFLAGPDRWEDWDGEGSLLDVDDVFAKTFERIMGEQREAHASYGGSSVEIEEDSRRTPSAIVEGFSFAEVEAGLLLLDPDGVPVGGYIGCDVALADHVQGKGLGAELILEFAMRTGGLPTWDLDEAAYSRAGETAHRAAHALARNRPLFERKRQAILSMEPSAPAMAP